MSAISLLTIVCMYIYCNNINIEILYLPILPSSIPQYKYAACVYVWGECGCGGVVCMWVGGCGCGGLVGGCVADMCVVSGYAG